MSVNKLGLSFFLLLAAVVSGGLVALPLRTIEAKERQSFRHASPVVADSGIANSAKVGGLAATVTSDHPRAIAQDSKWPNSSLLASLFLPQSSGSSFAISNTVAGRAVRVVGNTLTAGQTGTVSIEFDSQGDENAVGFSINFDVTKLTYVSTAKGIGAKDAGATLNTNPNLAASGHLGYALAVDAGTTFTAGTLQLAVVTFRAAAIGNGTSDITFGDAPIPHEITDDGHTGSILILPAVYTPATVTINALAPTLTSVSPTSAVTGGSAFTLTVNGTGFATSSVVRINGSNRPTTFINSTQLTAQVNATDIQASGSFPIDVLTPAPGGGVSSAINLGVGNPAPSISGLAPAIADAGGAGFTLTVNGSNFIGASVVKVNNSDRTTTFISGSQLTAEIPASDIQTAGAASVLVFNPTPGGGSSSPASLAITNPQPTLNNVAPATAVAGGASFTLTVNGSSFVNGSVVKFSGSDRVTSFVSNSQLTAQITAADIHSIGAFSISVFNPAPGGGTSLAVDLTVNNPIPVLNSLSPASAIVGGGAFTLTVSGSSFVNGAAVKFNGLDRPTSFVSSTQLTADITAADIQASGPSLITVFNPTPGGGTSGAIDFSVNNPVPVLASIAPASKLAGDDAFTLTVTGTNFVTGSVVRLNSSDCATTFVDATHLTAQITAADLQSAGAIAVTVFNPVPGGGTSGAVDLNVSNPTPVLASITPVSTTVGGPAFTLTVNGSSFVNGSVVKFNGSNRTTTFVSGTQLTAALTAADISALGTAQITVFNPVPGGGTSNSLSFTVNTNPALRFLRVGGATFQAGQNNTLNVEFDSQGDENALGFSLNFDTSKMSFVSAVRGSDAIEVNFNVNALQSLSGHVGIAIAKSAGEVFTAGTRQLVVVKFSVPLTSSGSTVVSFGDDPIIREVADPGNNGSINDLGTSYTPGTININHPAPTISSLSSTSAMAGDPALSLTVNGSNFVSGAVVKFNGNDRITNFDSSTQLTAQITAADVATAGIFSVVVVNPAPGGGASGSLSFTVNNPVPTLSSLSQTTATVGDPAFALAITGSNFVNGSVVKINGIDHATNFIGATQLTTQVTAADLASAGASAVLVFNPVPGGGTSNAIDFTVNNPVPTLSSISPTSTIVSGTAFTLTVNGTNFVNGSVVKAHGSDRVTTFVNSTQLTAQILATDIDTVGTFSIRVENSAPGGGSSLAKAFSVNNPVPVIGNLAPASAIAGDPAFTLTVNGTNFVNDSVIKWNGANRTTTFVNATQLTTQISAADIQAVGTATVAVLNAAPGGGTSDPATFSVLKSNDVPAIGTLSPLSAVAGGPAFTLTVNGSNFITGSTVKFNGNDRGTSFVNDTQVTAQITAADILSAGAFHITVFNPAPGGGLSNSVDFTVEQPNPVPSVSTLTPASATTGDAAFTLTVNGSNFIDGSVVRWNGSARTTSFISSTQLTSQITAADIQAAGTNQVTVFNPEPVGGESNAVNFAVANPPDPAKLEFSAANYQMSEAQNSIEITVVRTGNMAAAVTVDFATDDSGAFIPCGLPTGGADQRCDYGTTAGTLSFAAGEASKSFTLLNTDDAYVEGNETLTITLSNPVVLSNSSGVATSPDDAILGTPAQTTLMILDNDTAPPTNNPIDDARYFVNQHYLDFLSRLPDQEGIDYWTDQIAQCGTDAACVHSRRVAVSNAFFYENEFQETGAYVYRIYKAAFGTRPTYRQFMPDRSRVIGGAQLDQSKTSFANGFVQRTGFLANYPNSTTAAQYVDALNTNTGNSLTQAQRDALVNGLTDNTETSGSVLRKVADNQAFIDSEYGASFVLTEYFGYLRRDPEQEGFDFWLGQVNRFPLRDVGIQHAMVCSFITSIEYQQRFSSVVTHTNGECPQ